MNLEATLIDIQKSLMGRRLNLSDEKKLQEDIKEAFTDFGIEFEREVLLEGCGIVDFMVGALAIEIKIRGQVSSMRIYRQLERYAESERVQAVLLMTSQTMTLPETINGRPTYTFSLGRTQL